MTVISSASLTLFCFLGHEHLNACLAHIRQENVDHKMNKDELLSGPKYLHLILTRLKVTE